MNFLTHVGRWMRAARIRREQNRLLPRLYDRSTRKLVVFVVPGGSEPGKGTVGGGILSLVSLCNESARLRELHGAEVIMCVFPGDWPLLKFDWFENDRPVFRFDQLRSFFKDLDWILIHVPEYLSGAVFGRRRSKRPGLVSADVVLPRERREPEYPVDAPARAADISGAGRDADDRHDRPQEILLAGRTLSPWGAVASFLGHAVKIQLSRLHREGKPAGLFSRPKPHASGCCKNCTGFPI